MYSIKTAYFEVAYARVHTTLSVDYVYAYTILSMR